VSSPFVDSSSPPLGLVLFIPFVAARPCRVRSVRRATRRRFGEGDNPMYDEMFPRSVTIR